MISGSRTWLTIMFVTFNIDRARWGPDREKLHLTDQRKNSLSRTLEDTRAQNLREYEAVRNRPNRPVKPRIDEMKSYVQHDTRANQESVMRATVGSWSLALALKLLAQLLTWTCSTCVSRFAIAFETKIWSWNGVSSQTPPNPSH